MKFYSGLRPVLCAALPAVLSLALSARGQVTTLPASGISSHNGAATLNASVNPGGQPTAAFFQWGSTTNYGASTPPVNIGSGNSIVPTAAAITGLASLTNYHYRALATNASGTNTGNDLVFNTPFYPSAISAPSIVGGKLEATISGTTNALFGIYVSTNLVDWSLLPPGQFTFLSAHPFLVDLASVTNAGNWFYLMR